jgi:hypothetical protein
MSPRRQFIAGICSFLVVLALIVLLCIVLQDGTLIVPLAILTLAMGLFFNKCMNNSAKDSIEEDDDLAGVAVVVNVLNRNSIESNDAPKPPPPKDKVRISNTPLPTGWEKFKDESTGQTFYYNKSTDTTQWDHPSLQ